MEGQIRHGCPLKQAFLPDVGFGGFGLRQHIGAHEVEEIFANFKMAVAQPGGIFFPFRMRADNGNRAFAPDLGIGHVAAEGYKLEFMLIWFSGSLQGVCRQRVPVLTCCHGWRNIL